MSSGPRTRRRCVGSSGPTCSAKEKPNNKKKIRTKTLGRRCDVGGAQVRHADDEGPASDPSDVRHRTEPGAASAPAS